MGSTYHPAHDRPLDRARFALGDTGRLLDEVGEQVWLLADDTIIAELAPPQGYRFGLSVLAEGLAVRFAQDPDDYEEEDGIKVKWTERVPAWEKLAARMRAPVPAGESAASGASYGIAQMAAPDLSGLRL
ncbi:hypothetical protein EON81_04235 [bacterium]|nr:MAG: hypothetical protein EON81_04235 [bacterium]